MSALLSLEEAWIFNDTMLGKWLLLVAVSTFFCQPTALAQTSVNIPLLRQANPKQSASEFAAMAKAIYPTFLSVPDEELARKIVAKYPQYRAQVDFSSLAASEIAKRRAIVSTDRLGKPVATAMLYLDASGNLLPSPVSVVYWINGDSYSTPASGIENNIRASTAADRVSEGRPNPPPSALRQSHSVLMSPASTSIKVAVAVRELIGGIIATLLLFALAWMMWSRIVKRGLSPVTRTTRTLASRTLADISGPRTALAVVATSEAVLLAVTGYNRLSFGGDLFEEWGYGVLRWTILVVGGYGVASAVRVKSKPLLAWIIGTVLIFNPLRRPYLAANEWATLDLAAALIFGWLALVQLWRRHYPDRDGWV